MQGSQTFVSLSPRLQSCNEVIKTPTCAWYASVPGKAFRLWVFRQVFRSHRSLISSPRWTP